MTETFILLNQLLWPVYAWMIGIYLAAIGLIVAVEWYESRKDPQGPSQDA